MERTPNLSLSLLEPSDSMADTPKIWNENMRILDNAAFGGAGSGNVIKITFEAAFVGKPYTVTDGNETLTGSVPDDLVATVRVANCNSIYTIRAVADNGLEYSTSVTMGEYYGQYTATVSVFNATINVTTAAGAEVRAVCGSEVYTATADSSGLAAIRANQIGTYTISATKDGATSSSASVKVTSEITYTATVKFTIDAVPSQAGSLTYSGAAQSPAWNYYNANKLTLGGTTSSTNAGSNNASFTPKTGYQWPDGTATAKTVAWSINRATISVPSQSGSLTYTGSAQTPTWSGYDSGKMTIGGNSSGTNVGTYSASITPKDNYQWPDGSTGAKSVNWSIGKAAGSLSLSVSSMALNVATMTGTIGVTRAGDGAISASSSNTGVATVSVSGTNVVVTAKTAGSATITVNVAAGTNHNAPASKTCGVTVTLPSTTLNSNDWTTIKQVSDSGNGANYWKVGDTKTITINGKVGNYTFSNLSVQAFILGFDHNSAKEGTNRIHFQIGKIGEKAVALCDGQYNNEVTSAGYFNWNYSSNTNSGGWNGCYKRKTLYGNSNTPASPLANSLMAALPADLRAVMKSVTKYTDNTGGGSDTASYVTATTDYLFDLAEYEVFGARSYANSAEKNYQVQYDYYKAGNSKVANNHSSTGTAVRWGLRSPNCNTSSYFCSVGGDGTNNSNYADRSLGLRPGFSV